MNRRRGPKSRACCRSWVVTSWLTLSIACDTIEPPSGDSATVNECVSESCTRYVQSGGTPASCTSGVCLVTGVTDALVLLVAFPEDSAFVPGRTYTVRYDDLRISWPPASMLSAPCPAGNCAAFNSGFGVADGQYVISPNLEQAPPIGVGWNLGNSMNTAIPVNATFRLMWPAGGASAVDAQSLGLPVGPVVADSTVDHFAIQTPAGGPPIIYRAYLQPGTYERILIPVPPFDQAFAPEVKVVQVPSGEPANEEEDLVDSFDSTQETAMGPTMPTFDIARVGGTLDGWSAYLRDSANQVISNVVALHGTSVPNVVLATNHVPQGVDALTNAELVMAPPPGSPIPTGIFAPVGNVLPKMETYPQLGAPQPIQGTVSTKSGTPIAADLIFEALTIAGVNGFEFVGRASAQPGGETSPFEVVLPQGSYRVSIRPVSLENEVTIVNPFVVDGSQSAPDTNFTVDVPRTVQGTAIVADGRLLAGAIVEASPAGCLDGISDWCLPRAAQTTTSTSGTFTLSVDPGQYILRVRPADGSHLPWVAEPLSVPLDDAPVVVSAIKVPAPTSVGLSLFDPSGNAIVHAVVRAFSLPAQGSAVEIGSAVTGTDGRYEMYLALPSISRPMF